ncbi:SgcJ/EcaC family oxidoreductase [Streptomyces sp. NPDC060194]|uniref:SgcJ/EcaC family oxidoreductase n=1 Tax=Streptomyces sp. NPDC060194 TaxID=3347069 RepID=UPI00365F9E9B
MTARTGANTAATTDRSATTTDTATATDTEAITRLVAAVQRTQRARDAEGFLALFHPDAFWTTGHGKVLIGLDAIAAFTRAVLPGATWDGEVTYELAHLQFLTADVAAVKVRQVYRTSEAGGETDDEGTPLYVLTRQGDGRWLITAAQNTAVKRD